MKLSRLPHGFALDTAAQGLALRREAVQDITLAWTAQGWRASAAVLDGGQTFQAMAELTLPPEPRLLDSSCTCGRHRCRHVAALVLSTDPPEGQSPSQPQAAQPVVAAPVTEALDPRLKQWLAGFESEPDNSSGRGRQYELRYVLRVQSVSLQGGLPGQSRRAVLDVQRVPMKGGVPNLSAPEPYPLARKVGAWPSFVQRDSDALELLSVSTRPAHVSGRWNDPLYALVDHPATGLLISTLLDTGRLCWDDVSAPLRRADKVRAQPAWVTDESGLQSPALELEGTDDADLARVSQVVLPLGRPWVVDTAALTLAPVEVPGSPALLARFLTGPSVPPAQAPAVAQAMTAAALPIPAPLTVGTRQERLPYTPRLHLSGRTLAYQDLWNGAGRTENFAVAELRPAYGGHELRGPTTGKVVTVLSEQTVLQVPRQRAAEQRAERAFKDQGFVPLGQAFPEYLFPDAAQEFYTLGDEEAWLEFMQEGREALERQGIELVIHPDFPLHFAEVDDWYGEAQEGGGWFTLDLGIVVGGQRISLLPVLANLIAAQPELFTPGALAELDDDELIFAALDDGRKVPLPAGRVRSILGVLVELHLRELPPGPLRLPLLDAARLAELESALQARWVGAEKLLDLGKRLRDFGGIQEVAPPAGLHAEMRPYQLQGLAWLQFLREYELGGILADDMGLGKAQPLDAKVLTPLGWREMGELQVGDYVIGQSGQPTQIVGVYPQGERPIYRLTLTDGATVEADEEHLWHVNTPVRKRRGLPGRTLTTAQIAADLQDAAGNLKHYLPLVEAVQWPERPLPIDPYTLGALLGEEAADAELVTTGHAAVNSALHPQPFTAQFSASMRGNPGQEQMLRELGLHGKSGRDKFIPPDYLLGSPEQRLALLQGLLDTDGHAGEVVEYTSVSEHLARGVVELVQSLGGVARIRQKATSHTYGGEKKSGTAWRVTLKLPPHLEPFRLSSKRAAYRPPTKYPPTRGIKAVEFVGHKPAQCIAVAAADHLYVTEGYVVTHNTLQTLAHILKEKEEGRADLPTLVIAPTSVIGNWQAEAAKFTPGLRVLLLHGKDRHADFDQIPQADVVLTTYPLLPRDIDELRRFQYHLVILDEAQNIKNNKTAAAKAAGSLSARHRLALTGTPLENHLGELWSQFNFLAPGLLHDEKTFQKLYRTPIEKRGDTARQAALSARVRPFILRREKRDVARELPPKTEIPVRVTLEGDQRDLYETVRVTMQSRVREELAARGLARSTIAILDALLKLRQAVTDPRLVKLDAARTVESNAKLDWLEGNLPQMVEEGRRVLIFSGFATLLGHLEDFLKRENIPYSKITGQTKDRQKQIDAFQNGETHVFLITLKAGGVGLNLTAADTVIHYDPWWNPAAEDQATDRAYRIGQDKPVFVYKLIAAGSVEERILDLQARKAALARGVLDGGLTDATQLTVQDLDRLFAPLELGEASADEEGELVEG
ncbi:SNF2-related protein [Deinococcus sp. VB343]|uniref:SNF2-related protein n=1 Tax=Deinococcus sp. VB343 TaxID=3385567 RepID=UPI0039C8C2AB